LAESSYAVGRIHFWRREQQSSRAEEQQKNTIFVSAALPPFSSPYFARLTAGASAGRHDAYRRMLARGFRAERIGVSMWLHPEEPCLEAAGDYVVNDLR